MRDAWLPLGLALVGGVALLACGQAFELTGSTGTGVGGAASAASAVSAASAGGGGVAASSGGGSATTTSTTSTSSTGGGQCTTAADCTELPTTLCGEAACQGGKCGLHGLQNDGLSFSQRYGDCHVAVCFKAILTNAIKGEDIYDDGNPCTKDSCDNGVPSNVIKVGAQCGASGVCSSKGTCVECLSNGVCSGNKSTCINGYCSASTCQNGGALPDGNETDVDCGGDECGPCDAGQTCEAASDCKSKVCELPDVGALKQCQIASCTDTVQNGTETDVDCGGVLCSPSSKCDDSKYCVVPGDCKSGVCQGGTCQEATCGDGVKNGSEVGVDCGGGGRGCATKCPPG